MLRVPYKIFGDSIEGDQLTFETFENPTETPQTILKRILGY